MPGRFALEPTQTIYIAGHRGLAGSAVWREFERRGFRRLIGRTSTELDLRDRDSTFRFLHETTPDVVILAAGRVGGILANDSHPVEFISDNLRIQVNVLDAALEAGVSRLLFLGSSCIYPKFADQPIREEALLQGPLEPTNEAYAIAKIAGILHVQALRKEYGLPYISAMPSNLYGLGDNFADRTSHVLPAMLRRYHEAKLRHQTRVVNWGSGMVRREFLHIDDLARACVFLLDNYDDSPPINVGTGEDVTIRELAEIVSTVVGFRGETAWDESKPDGTPRKLLDTTRIRSLGWRPQVPLVTGISETYEWFCERVKTNQPVRK